MTLVCANSQPNMDPNFSPAQQPRFTSDLGQPLLHTSHSLLIWSTVQLAFKYEIQVSPIL